MRCRSSSSCSGAAGRLAAAARSCTASERRAGSRGRTERLHEDDHLLILGSDDGSELALSQGKPIAGELPRTNHFGFRLADEAAVRAARDRFRAAGVVETEWQDDGRFVRVQVADPDGYRVEVYAHY